MSESASSPPRPSSQPELTPQLCFNSTVLRDFIRLSRSTVDDSLSLHLNSLLTPARRGFVESSTSARPLQLAGGSSQRQIPRTVCQEFKHSILFPSWKARDEVFEYCSQVAEAPEEPPKRPDSTTPPRQMHMPSDKVIPLGEISPISRLASGESVSRNYWGQEQTVNERLDPYSARDYSYTRQPRTQELRDLLRNEAGVETIIRARTWSLLGERCLGGAARDWQEDYRAWVYESDR